MTDTKEVTPDPMQVQQIPLSLINADEAFNARSMTDEHPDGEGARESYKAGASVPTIEDGSDGKSLAASMKKNGLRQPILVRPATDKDGTATGGYDLVAGFRRYTAASSLGWTHIACVVQPMDDLEAYLANLEENVQRENLSPGEIADRCLFLKEEHEMDGGDIATRLNLSKSYVNNLMRMAKELHKDIWKVARSGRNASAPPQSKLLKWCALDSAEQLAEYRKFLGDVTDDESEDGEESGGDEGDDKERTRASLKRLEELRDALFAAKKGGDHTEDWLKGALAVVDYATGRRKNPPVKMPEKAPKAKKEGASAEN